jgi:hypothetical protein
MQQAFRMQRLILHGEAYLSDSLCTSLRLLLAVRWKDLVAAPSGNLRQARLQ